MDEQADSSFPNWPEFRRLFTYDDLVGKVIQGRYRIERRLGAGGMGVVFLAHHIHLDKPFALKIISPRFLDEPEISRRFLQEARAASKIDHPNIVSITDFGPPEEGPAFFAMEYLDGEDLARLLRREGPLPWPRVLTIAAQIARALAAAHQRGVIHRDIKPQNCLRVAREDNPDFIKVLDFGLAKVVDRTGKSAWTVGGSPGYIAPEIYRGGRTDHRVDIFSLGVVIHTLLLGRLPAQTPGEVELPPGAPVRTLADLPAPLRALIARATADDPEQRYPTAEAMLAAIEETRAALTDPAKDLAQRTGRRGWVAPSVLAAGLVAAAVALAVTRAGEAPAAPRVAAPQEPRPAPPAAPVADPAGSPPVPGVPKDMAPETSPPGEAPAVASPPAEAPVQDVPRDMSPETGPPAEPRPAVRLPFDEAAARAVLAGRAAGVRACKARSTFRGVETTVRLVGTVTVSARGRATLELPPGYDVNPCLERLVAGLRFRPSLEGGRFTHTFLL